MEEVVEQGATNCDYLFKVVLVGDSGVGKSCITNRFTLDSYIDSYLTTIGVDFSIKVVDVDGELVKLQVWDTAGQERFRTIVPNYYRAAHGVILVYDCTDKKSFDHLSDWFREVDRYASEDADRVIVGNKTDSNLRRVDFSLAKKYAESLGIPFYETSAKTGTNVEKMFKDLASSIKRRVDASDPGKERKTKLYDKPKKESKFNCC